MTASSGERDAADPQTRRLTWLYLAALSFLALLTVAGQVATQRSIARQLDDSRLVNLAGRQRMLSQRLTQLALRIEREARPERREELRHEYAEAFESWTAAHAALRNGSDSLGVPDSDSEIVVAMFAELDQTYVPMRAAGEALLAAASDPIDAASIGAATESWLKQETAFLDGMDAIVSQYETEARDRVADLRLIEAALLIATLSTLAAEATFVFRPAVRRIARYVEKLRDLNRELAIAERRASQADAAKTHFLAGMSHELRTPMSAILGVAALSLERAQDPQAKRLLGALHQSAKSLSEMLDELLDLASFDAGAGPAIVTEPFPVRAAIENAADLFRPTAERKGLQFFLTVSDEVPASANGDEKRLGQILANLLSNAIKFTEEGSVELKASAQAENRGPVWLIVEVIDTGPGVPREHAELIFERFSRVDPSTRRRASGAGLGLAISSELAKAMGGTITLDLERASGSRFVLRLPLERDANSQDANAGGATTPADAVEPISTAAACERGSARPRALIADDSDSSRLLLAERLRDLGFEVTEASDGGQAREAARLGEFAAILLDLEMPGLDGFETLRSLRAAQAPGDAAPRIIAVTAHLPDDIRQRCVDAGFDALFMKPVAAISLMNELGSVVDRSPRNKEDHLEAGQDVHPAVRKIRSRFERREALLARLVELYFVESPELHARLRAASDAGDSRALAAVLHRWKGTCANFHLTELDETFVEFEKRLGSQAAPTLSDLSPLLESIAALESALRLIEAVAPESRNPTTRIEAGPVARSQRESVSVDRGVEARSLPVSRPAPSSWGRIATAARDSAAFI